ncbi:MAG: ribonuclease E/G [Lachnospiraceae bacterium]|nr:ribonuclease E/G [Lachnospiraceae bacterium]MCR5768904.1 ribonuclease E/G [Lachnospiraceae bacterium]
MGSKLIYLRDGSRIITGLIDDTGLVEVQVDPVDSESLLGNIYLGKVKNIVKNINSAFVEVEDGKMCYLALSDVKSPIMASNDHPGKLRIGDELIVQVTRDSAKNKAPLATSDFSLAGKYIVLVHGRKAIGISQKIKDETKRKRLKEILKPYLNENYAFIVRTNAESAPEDLLEREVARLANDYRQIVEFGVHWKCFSKLYSTPPAYLWEIRDGYAEEIEEIKTDDDEIYGQLKQYLAEYQPEDSGKLVKYNDPQLSLAKLYGIMEKIEKALKERVWLDSGGYLVIQPTEALTVIDVNTGKAVSGKTVPEETFLAVNTEAADEIARQVRLRNLSGIIVIDFIDMVQEEHRKALLKHLSAVLAKDRIPTKVVDMTQLNLVEVTRKKIRKPLADQMGLNH